MQKVFTLLVIAILSSVSLLAQETQTLTATVIRTKHNIAVMNDLETKGSFYFKQPDKMCMIFNEGKEMLLMDGTHFIMVNNEKSSVAKGKGAEHLGLLQKVLISILLGENDNIDTYETVEMEITREDNTIHLTPVATSSKTTRRLMFTSFILTVDPESSGLTSMCMNERGGNYTRYDFSGFVSGEAVDDAIFNLKH